MKVDIACLGNNELNYGVARMTEMLSKFQNPWLMANMCSPDDSVLPGLKEYHVIEKEGHKIGFFGLASPDWTMKYSEEMKQQVIYHDYLEVATRVIRTLREDEGIDFLIAVVHIRQVNDTKLAETFGD